MKKKAALYDPYLDVLGGGEKHILSIVKVLSDEDYDIDIFWDSDLTKEIKKRFNLTFPSLKFQSNIFKKNISVLTRTTQLASYEYFFYVTDGSYFFSLAKNNFVFCMVPSRSLYSMSVLNKLKTSNVTFISNSEFTRKHLASWGIKSKVLYPYIDKVFFERNSSIVKQKIILSVGRFFGGLHVKNHTVMISYFNKLVNSGLLNGYKLVLAGGLKKEDETYFENLKRQVKNNPNLILKPNVKFKELFNLYRSAEYYWHFTGLGVDEVKQPEKTEHLGIAPLEAMALSCISFCYEKELFEKMSKILADKRQRENIQTKSQAFVRENFGYDVFQKKVKEILFNH